MKMNNELKIGFLVITALILFILGYAFIKNKNIFSTNRTYYILCDNVSGISVSDPVSVRGIKIGVIKEFKLHDNSVKVAIETNGKIKIPDNSVVNIDGGNLFGRKQLSLVIGNSLEEAKDGSMFNVEQAKGIFAELDPIKENLNITLRNLNNAIDSINVILDNNTKQNLKKSVESLANTLDNFQRFSKTLNNQSGNIASVISEAKSFTRSLNKTFPKLDNTIANFEALSSQFKGVNFKTSLMNTQKTLDKINASFVAHNNIMSALFNDDKLYHNLIQTTADLDRLLVDIRNNPQSFFHFSLFGKKLNLKQSTYKVQDAPVLNKP
ncbi:MAG: MlaD family protein [Solitalea-like symbiont of Acarus siro]